MYVIPLKQEIHYRHDFANFMKMFKGLASAMFKEWEQAQKIQAKIEEERKNGQMSLQNVILRDIKKIGDLGIFKEFTRLGRAGYFMVK